MCMCVCDCYKHAWSCIRGVVVHAWSCMRGVVVYAWSYMCGRACVVVHAWSCMRGHACVQVCPIMVQEHGWPGGLAAGWPGCMPGQGTDTQPNYHRPIDDQTTHHPPTNCRPTNCQLTPLPALAPCPRPPLQGPPRCQCVPDHPGGSHPCGAAQPAARHARPRAPAHSAMLGRRPTRPPQRAAAGQRSGQGRAG